MSATSAGELLDVARRLSAYPPADLAGRWPRAVALLTRQSLEIAIDDFWADRATAVAQSRAWRPKLLCLETYLKDPELGREINQLWAALSRACHVHAYELDPTIDELRGWMDAVTEVELQLRTDLTSTTAP
ncbi:MAG: hypothetical protein FJW86_12805 [Actinobacteria bacterium]|nr:hypothetical protein [Actinomycetota bacterium]